MGYWKEKAKYQEQVINNLRSGSNIVANLPDEITCQWCGRVIKYKERIICQGNHTLHLFTLLIGRLTEKLTGRIICKKCAAKCKKCRRYYCPKHIDDHKCK